MVSKGRSPRDFTLEVGDRLRTFYLYLSLQEAPKEIIETSPLVMNDCIVKGTLDIDSVMCAGAVAMGPGAGLQSPAGALAGSLDRLSPAIPALGARRPGDGLARDSGGARPRDPSGLYRSPDPDPYGSQDSGRLHLAAGYPNFGGQ